MFKKATGITNRIRRSKALAVKTLFRIEGDVHGREMSLANELYVMLWCSAKNSLSKVQADKFDK